MFRPDRPAGTRFPQVIRRVRQVLIEVDGAIAEEQHSAIGARQRFEAGIVAEHSRRIRSIVAPLACGRGRRSDHASRCW